ncbi:hypothetical protein EYF80_025135 [Liparis tanakae]|uniref:Uncharacterized protein n=1 Tax=Liparis tanakae TaxID=230148 RepID=A0A4Z2HFX7_9TELE|nr:hypothetical protein EYF80_025135 [Liparis tanakae]
MPTDGRSQRVTTYLSMAIKFLPSPIPKPVQPSITSTFQLHIPIVSYPDSPDSRVSLTLLQKTSQALLVESFTCSLKDLRRGVFLTAGV